MFAVLEFVHGEIAYLEKARREGLEIVVESRAKYGQEKGPLKDRDALMREGLVPRRCFPKN